MVWDVLGLGAVAVDDLFYVERYPPVDSKTPVLASQRQGGGLAGTALVTVARLEARAAYCGVLGDDELSHFTRQELERHGVDCSPCLYQAGARPVYAIAIVERLTGARTLFYDRSGFIEPPVEWITPALLASCRVLFVDHTVMGAALHAARLAHSLGIPVVADIEPGADERRQALLAMIDHLVIGIELGHELTSQSDPAEMVAALAAGPHAAVVVTAGAQGCWYAAHAGPVRHCPAIQVQVVDTVGCGDVFHGAYAASLARGEGLDRAVKIATITAGLKTTRPGGRAGIPSWTAVEKLMQDHPDRDHSGR